MSQPSWLAGREHRREAVVVDGDEAWALFCASADGDAGAVRDLVNRNPDLIYAQIWYQQPVDLAMRGGHLGAVKLLMEADSAGRLGSRLYQDHHYRPMEGEIARRGFGDVVSYLRGRHRSRTPGYRDGFEELKTLIDSGDSTAALEAVARDRALTAATDRDGQSPAHLAVRRKDLVLLMGLVELGASLDGTTAGGATVMDYAAEYFPDVIPYLLDRGVTPTVGALAARGMTGELRQMLERDRSLANQLDPCGNRPLSHAARHRQHGATELLLGSGADPNAPVPDGAHGDALFIATGHWDTRTMRLLLEAGANPNAEIDSSGCCLSRLVDHRKWGNHPARNSYELLVAHGAVDPPWAMSDAQLLENLKEAGGDELRREFDHGWAEVYHHLRSVEQLDLYVDRVGDTAVRSLWWDYQVADVPDPDMFRRLVHHGMDVNHRDWLGRTWLHALAARGAVEAAGLAVELGAEIDPVDVHSSTTPLGYAAREGQVAMVEWLLARGAQPNPPDAPARGQPSAYAHDLRDCLRDGRTYAARLFTGEEGNATLQDYDRVIELLG